MTEEQKQFVEPRQPTEAEEAKTIAEARKIEADTELSRAQIAKANAETAYAQAQAAEQHAHARIAELEALRKEERRREEEAGDVFHHVYRFTGSVNQASADACIEKLTEWHRLDPGCDMEIIFFSPGGAVIPGFALFDHIRYLSQQGHKMITGATGMAASMAGILVQAGDVRWMSGESWYMIHRAAFGAAGKTFEIEDEVEWVKRIEARIIKIFTSRSTLTPQKIKRNWDRKDWWLDSDQCLEYGLVDQVRGVQDPT